MSHTYQYYNLGQRQKPFSHSGTQYDLHKEVQLRFKWAPPHYCFRQGEFMLPLDFKILGTNIVMFTSTNHRLLSTNMWWNLWWPFQIQVADVYLFPKIVIVERINRIQTVSEFCKSCEGKTPTAGKVEAKGRRWEEEEIEIWVRKFWLKDNSHPSAEVQRFKMSHWSINNYVLTQTNDFVSKFHYKEHTVKK